MSAAPLQQIEAPRRRSALEALKPTSLLTSLASPVRHLVSKKKRRFKQDGFDLDLSYITPQIIAMGYPSRAVEAAYRNPAGQVKLFFEHFHPGRAKVYNLCIERSYPASIIGLPDDLVEVHPGYDHNALPLFAVPPFCRSAGAWLGADPKRVCAIHCKAGKGRTGMLICCYLVWSGDCTSAAEALALFGRMRTHNGKGVTIPSQQRYVRYTEQLVREAAKAEGAGGRPPNASPMAGLRQPPLRRLINVLLVSAPEFAMAPGVYFTVDLVHREEDAEADGGPPPTRSPKWQNWRAYDHRNPYGVVDIADVQKDGTSATAGALSNDARPSGRSTKLAKGLAKVVRGPFSSKTKAPQYTPAAGGAGGYDGMTPPAEKSPLVTGDVKVTVYLPNGKTLAACWFHTHFVDGDRLTVPKLELDKARKKKELPADFAMQIDFGPPVGAAEEATERQSLAELARNSVAMPPGQVDEEDHEDDDDDDDHAPGDVVLDKPLFDQI